MVPWFAYLYMAILSLLTLAGIIEELKNPAGKIYALGTFITFIILINFVVGVYVIEVGEVLGLLSLPLLLLAIVYDFYLSGIDLDKDSKDFGQPLDDIKTRMDLLTATIIVAPGYISGLIILYRALTAS